LARAKDKISFGPVEISKNGISSAGSADSGIGKMPLSLKFAHGIFDGKNTKFAGVLQFGMPELSLADRLRKSAFNGKPKASAIQ
jgi:hypothetical protein